MDGFWFPKADLLVYWDGAPVVLGDDRYGYGDYLRSDKVVYERPPTIQDAQLTTKHILPLVHRGFTTGYLTEAGFDSAVRNSGLRMVREIPDSVWGEELDALIEKMKGDVNV